MAGSIEIMSVVAIVAIGAVVLPIVLDENPNAFLENGLCTIFVGNPPLGNTTCNDIKGNVTFIADFPIVITPDNVNNTITWSFGSMGNATHNNIGGGAEIFKNETGGMANLRTLTGSGGVTVTQNSETINIATGGGGPTALQNINTPNQGIIFNATEEGDTVTFVGQGIAISNSSSVVLSINATVGELIDVNVTNVDEDQILFYNASSMQFENEPLNSLVSLVDQNFNAEEATIDDLTGIDCVNDVTYSFFGNIDIHEYRRQAVEFCPDSEPDDNITWLYVVPSEYTDIAPRDFKFRLFWTDDDTDADSFMKRVDDDDDDAEESVGPINPGDISLGSSDLELHCENCVETNDNDLIGMRWTNVTIPQGVTILNATIQFHVDQENPDEPIIVRFAGHDVDDAPVFTSTDFDISSRANTTATVDWNVPHWESVSDEGPDQRTPNLAAIVQEIIDRPGWSSGNAMVIKSVDWVDCTPTSCPTNFGQRHAESHDGEPSSAPLLSVFWSIGGGGDPAPVCFELSMIALQNTNDMDGDFIGRDTVCVNRSGSDKLSVTEFEIDSTEHQFEADDLVFFRIHRPDNFVPDDFESNVFLFGAELEWIN